ncbi:MAG: hypothetical protein QNJ61_04240 [Desulfobacterales bacterium]|nr:hypothetical protein [Desulfobacterales bacterium]
MQSKWWLAVIILGVMVIGGLAGAGEQTIPQAVGPFALGQDIADLAASVRMETALPLRYQEYLNEVEIKPLAGFKSGLITYGLCAQPGQVVRIKLKYLDSRREFYDALLERVKQRFGRPSEYNGDPFHIVISWKWSFADADGHRITLNLAHNTRDVEEKYGNTLKISMLDAMAQERQCYLKQNPVVRQREADRPISLQQMSPQEWDRLVPR